MTPSLSFMNASLYALVIYLQERFRCHSDSPPAKGFDLTWIPVSKNEMKMAGKQRKEKQQRSFTASSFPSSSPDLCLFIGSNKSEMR